MVGSSDPDHARVVANLRARFPSGRICSGVVRRVLRSVAFVRLDDAQGVINTLHLTSGYVRDFNERLRVGQVVTAEVMYVDEANAVVYLSTKVLEANPAAPFSGRIGEMVPATIVAVPQGGAVLLTLSDTLVALLAATDEERAGLREGDRVRVRIREVDLGTEPGTHRVTVAMP